jgi:hypothetical protein
MSRCCAGFQAARRGCSLKLNFMVGSLEGGRDAMQWGCMVAASPWCVQPVLLHFLQYRYRQGSASPGHNTTVGSPLLATVAFCRQCLVRACIPGAHAVRICSCRCAKRPWSPDDACWLPSTQYGRHQGGPKSFPMQCRLFFHLCQKPLCAAARAMVPGIWRLPPQAGRSQAITWGLFSGQLARSSQRNIHIQRPELSVSATAPCDVPQSCGPDSAR